MSRRTATGVSARSTTEMAPICVPSRCAAPRQNRHRMVLAPAVGFEPTIRLRRINSRFVSWAKLCLGRTLVLFPELTQLSGMLRLRNRQAATVRETALSFGWACGPDRYVGATGGVGCPFARCKVFYPGYEGRKQSKGAARRRSSSYPVWLQR